MTFRFHFPTAAAASLSPSHFTNPCATRIRLPALRFLVRSNGGDEASPVPASSPPPTPSPNNAEERKGAGFGGDIESKRNKRRGREKGAVIRRSPIQKPSAGASSGSSDAPQLEQQGVNESAFLLTWLGLGSLILIEGITLAASGFLPDEWDYLFVKYLYPSFTPTVFLFIGGTAIYGLYKYLQGERANK